MTVSEHWENQKPLLWEELNQKESLADAADAIRHALRQTEQNALADLGDDHLRQQAGILFSCVRSSVSLLEAQNAATVWTAQKAAGKRTFPVCWGILAALIVSLCLYCSFKEWHLGMWLSAGALICAAAAFLSQRKHLTFPKDEVRVTLRPDAERLIAQLDGQMLAIDRSIDDFLSLNTQLRASAETADPAAVALAADLMEALYEADGAQQPEAEQSARRLLACLGLQALEYSNETSALFSTLPSKNTTRTLCPAIVSVQDQKLLRRGTAAVRTGAA